MPGLVNTPAVELVIMDVLMPEISGIQACKHIRAAPGSENLPILMISAHDESEWLDQALAAGATDYIPKPLNRAQLTMPVRAAVQRKDDLTGLANWRYLDECLDNAWRRDRRAGNELTLNALDV